MLRMHFLRSWFKLSDEGVEDMIHGSHAFRWFMKINFHDEQVPDATTLLKFGHLPEEPKIGELLFGSLVTCLGENAL